jgi:pilus assembly protein Flp/PilA
VTRGVAKSHPVRAMVAQIPESRLRASGKPEIEAGTLDLDEHVPLGVRTWGTNMKTFLKTFLKDESGASAAEYALILAVVGVAIGGAALLLADEIQQAMVDGADRVEDCANAADGNVDGGCTIATAED